MSKYYHVCAQNIGRPVVVRTVDGKMHRGRIARVTPTHLYLAPIGHPASAPVGEIHATHALDARSDDHAQTKEIIWGWGYGAGLVTGLAFGAIASLAFLPWFWI
jgi:hypothetical protein